MQGRRKENVTYTAKVEIIKSIIIFVASIIHWDKSSRFVKRTAKEHLSRKHNLAIAK